ncbi:S1C family serine protease [Akkermansiaceae bacterium]|nr:S1C family serine protease [Akkermansiaceae bacterium]
MRLGYHLVLALFCFSFVSAEEKKAMPWVGVILHQPSLGMERPVEMSAGGGLYVHQVTSDAPLAKAGGQKGDLWWKLDDQILVNRGQLVVLLKLRAPGDEVKLHFFREGKLMTRLLVLGKRPKPVLSEKSKTQTVFNSVNSINPKTKKPRGCRVEEVAEMTSRGIHYQVTDGEGGIHARISEGEKILFDGSISSDVQARGLKPQWVGSLLILRQALVARKGGEGRSARRRYLPRSPRESN